jgi:hypothetical protein
VGTAGDTLGLPMKFLRHLSVITSYYDLEEPSNRAWSSSHTTELERGSMTKNEIQSTGICVIIFGSAFVRKQMQIHVRFE